MVHDMNPQSNYQNSHFYKPRNNYRYKPFIRRSPVHHTRSFDELNQERAYLLNSLQCEDLLATNLLKNISNARESLRGSLDPTTRRKVKKEIAWLHSRLEKTARQEKSILARLGQVSYEIQYKERCKRVENERHVRDMEFEMQAMNPSPITSNSMYQHGWNHSLGQYWNANQHLPASAYSSELPVPDEEAFLNQMDECKLPTGWKRSSSLKNLEAKFEKEKRLSVPVVSSEFSDRFQNIKDVQYVGYYCDNRV